jgi:hypothetical protein
LAREREMRGRKGKPNSDEEGGREENGQGKERRMERDRSDEDGRLEREGIGREERRGRVG